MSTRTPSRITTLALLSTLAWTTVPAPARSPEAVERRPDSLQELLAEADRSPAEHPAKEPLPRPLVPGSTVDSPESYSLSVDGDIQAAGHLFQSGYPLLHNDGGIAGENTALGLGALVNSTPNQPGQFSAWRNTAIGFQALNSDTTASRNTAVGALALRSSTIGSRNTAVGTSALEYNIGGTINVAIGFEAMAGSTSGSYNAVLGAYALQGNTFGDRNVAVGWNALRENRLGDQNTAVGGEALLDNDTGNFNTGIGWRALRDVVYGSSNTGVGAFALFHADEGERNTAVGARALESSRGSDIIAIGYQAGFDLLGGSNSIFIGHLGEDGDEGVIRVGTAGTHFATYLAGAFGQSIDAVTAAPLSIDSEGKLGTMASSARFKEQIRDMGAASRALLELRPVEFRYRGATPDTERPRQYGLIAEEVAESIPELVVRDAAGEPLSIRYELLGPLLVNELQRQERRIHELEHRLLALEGSSR